MLKLTLKGLAAHKLRYLLTIVAITIGVAFLSGTLVLTDTLRKVFNDLVANQYENVDVVVRGQEQLEIPFGGFSLRNKLPANLIDDVSAVDGVADAEGVVVIQYAQLVNKKGKPIGDPASGAPTLGFNWIDNDALRPLALIDGRAPRAADEIAIDTETAGKSGYTVGDRAPVLSNLPTQDYEIVGIGEFRGGASLAGATTISFTTAQAQKIANIPEQFDEVWILGDRGVKQTELDRRVKGALGPERIDADQLDIVTGEEATKEGQNDFANSLGFFNIMLDIFAFIALFVTAFNIYNSFSIIVAQRLREMALLRAIGAKGGQVTRSVLAESIVIGIVASAVGTVIGIWMAGVLRWVFGAFAIPIPVASTVLTKQTIVICMLVGVVLTVGCSILPARRAAKIPPIAALREVAVERTRGFGRRVFFGTVITALGVATLLAGLFGSLDSSISFVGAGALVIFIGVFVLAPVISRPFSKAIGAPLPRLKGMTGQLARENARRNPKRTARTAAALMIGVALVGFITIFGSSAKASVADGIGTALDADFIISAGGFGGGGVGFPPELTQQVSLVGDVEAATAIQFGFAEVADKKPGQFIVGTDPADVTTFLDLDVVRGDLAELGGDGVAVQADKAESLKLRVGDRITMRFQTGTQEFTVTTLYDTKNFGDFYISTEAFRANTTEVTDASIYVKLKPGVTPDEGAKAIEPLLKSYPNAKLQDQAKFEADQVAQINGFINLIYVMLAFAVLIAVIGIVNTLALSVFERTRELGLLRAVGMEQEQVRSSVRWESVIITLFGTLLGLILGLLFAYSIVLALRDDGFTIFSIGTWQLPVIVALSILVGTAAGVGPAWWAARRDLLQAIASE